MLKNVFKNPKKYFEFIWCRDRTKLDPDYGKDPDIEKYDTIKMLKDIIDCPDINQDRNYGFHNIIICDDSRMKTRFNPAQNIVTISPWVPGQPFDIESLLKDINEQFNIIGAIHDTKVTKRKYRSNSI